MPSSIDNRIVQMSFDNKQFEEGVKTSLGTLDKLNEKLQFKDLDSGYLKNISSSLEMLSGRFSALGVVGMTVVSRLTNNFMDQLQPAINAISQTIDSLTVNYSNLMNSFAKYEGMVANQQTIMSSVSDKINALTGSKYGMEDVSAIIDRLRWYTDETSYNLDQMVNAIGDFTASGIDLAESEGMILGIANACADAGISADKADIAMRGFSRAIGSGGITLQTWNTMLKTSGLTNSERFRQSLLDAAEASGTLIRVNGKLMTSDKKHEVTLSNLTETLTEYGWANTKVLNKVLSDYSNTVNGVYALTGGGKLDLTTEAFKDLTKAMEEQGRSLSDLKLDQEYDQASEAIKALTDAYVELGLEVPKSLKAFTRAQEAITYTQAIEATATAVRSQWARTFELIFGNYEEAKGLWTGVSNSLWGIFAGGGDTRNDIFSNWHEDSYERFSEAITNAVEGVESLAYAFRSLFAQLVSGDVSKYIDDMTNTLNLFTQNFSNKMKGFKEFANAIDVLVEASGSMHELTRVFELFGNVTDETYKDVQAEWLSDDASSALRSLVETFGDLETGLNNIKSSVIKDVVNTLHGFAAVLDLIKQAASGFWRATEPLRELVGDLAIKFLGLTGSAGEWLTNLASSAKSVDFFYNVFKKVVDVIMNVGVPAFESLSSIFKGISNVLKPLGQLFTDAKTAISDFFSAITGGEVDKMSSLSDFFEGLGNILNIVASKIGSAAKSIASAFKEIFAGIDLKQIGELINLGLKGGILSLIFGKLKGGGKADDSFDPKSIVESFTKPFSSLAESLKNFSSTLKSETTSLIKIAAGVFVLAVSLRMLSSNPEGLASAAISLGVLMAELYGVMRLLSEFKLDKAASKNLDRNIKSVQKMSVAVLILAVALKQVAGLDEQGIVNGLVALGGVLLEVSLVSGLIKNFNANGMIKLATSMLIFAVAMKAFGSFEWDEIIRGGSAIGIILTEVGLFFAAMNKWGTGVAKTAVYSAAMIAMGAAMVIFAGALKIIGSMSLEQISNGMMVISVALLEFAVATAVMGSAKSLAGAGATLIMANALLLLAPSLLLLGKAKLSTIGKGLLALAGAFVVISVAGTMLKGTELTILAFGASIALIGAGLAAMAIGITTLATGISVGGVAIAEGLQLIVLSVARLIPTVIESIGEGIIAFIKLIADSATTIVDSFVQVGMAILLGLRTLIPEFVATGGLVLMSLLQGIAVNIFKMAQIAGTIIAEFLRGLSQTLPDVISAGVEFIISFINGLAEAIVNNSDAIFEAIQNLLKSVLYFVVSALDSLTQDIPVVGDTIHGLLENIKGDIKSSMNFETGGEIGREFGTGLGEQTTMAITQETPAVEKATGDMSSAITDELSETLDEVPVIGKYIPEGLAEGISENQSVAINASIRLANNAISAAKRALGVHSPSKAFEEIGMYSDQGFAQGFSKYSSLVENSATETANAALMAFKNPLYGLSEVMSDEVDLNPTITPVLDLSEIQNGSKNIGNMLNGTVNGISSIGDFSRGNRLVSPTINVTFNSTQPINNDTANTIADNLAQSISNELGKLIINF